MFYSDEQIRLLRICDICSNDLCDPKLVPCGQTFCYECILKSSDNIYFKCICEKERHVIPEEGFLKNLLCERLLNQKPDSVSRGGKADQLKIKLDKMRAEINDVQSILRVSEDKIRDHCDSLRNEIDLAAETIIQDIQNQREDLIKKVDEYQIECLGNYQSNNSTKQELINSLEESKDLLMKWENLFNHHKIDELEIENALNYSESYVKKLTQYKENSKRYIFGDKLIEFVPSICRNQPIGTIKSESLSTNLSNLDFSRLMKTELNSAGINTNGILNKRIDFDILADENILVCLIDINRLFRVYIIDSVTRKIIFSREMPWHYSSTNPISIKCTSFNKNILISVIYKSSFTKNYLLYSDNLNLYFEKVVYCYTLDTQIDADLVYILAKTCDNKYVVKIYNHCFDEIRLIQDLYSANYQVTNIKVNKHYLALLDLCSRVTLISLKDELLIAQFKSDGNLFSFYNESSIITYNTISRLFCLYDIQGSKEHEQKFDGNFNPTIIKGGVKRILFFDKEKNEFYQ